MNVTVRFGGTLLLLTALAPCAWSQGNSDSLTPELSRPDDCRLEVAKFDETIGLLRQIQGNKAAADLKEKLMPAKMANDLLLSKGYCGLANYIREKKLNR